MWKTPITETPRAPSSARSSKYAVCFAPAHTLHTQPVRSPSHLSSPQTCKHTCTQLEPGANCRCGACWHSHSHANPIEMWLFNQGACSKKLRELQEIRCRSVKSQSRDNVCVCGRGITHVAGTLNLLTHYGDRKQSPHEDNHQFYGEDLF